VEAADLRAKTLRLAGGGALTFEKLVIATGARVRRAPARPRRQGQE
jgi:NADPH-dependent 2,4-dienoyl-CoA reductase/sulfur reductase-like enzyme